MSNELINLVWRNRMPLMASHKFILMRLADCVRDGGDGWSWMSIDRIAADCNLHRRTTQRIIDSLESMGLIRVEIRTGPKNTNRYQVIAEALLHVEPTGGTHATMAPTPPWHPRHHDGGTHATPPVASRTLTRGTTPPNPKENPKITPPHPSAREAGGGGGDGNEDLEPADRIRLILVLERLGVASGPDAARRWLVQARRNHLAENFDDHLRVIVYAVKRARAESGQTINYASEVMTYVKSWRPQAAAENSEPQ